MRSLALASLAPWLAVALLALGCSAERGDKQMGERCADTNECARGLCVGGVRGAEPVCTRSCASTDDCPRGWACSGVTQDQVLVCSFGAPTPFGIGARE